MPFINPILWVDWLAIYAFSGLIWPGFSFISAIMGTAIFAVSLWLCIGYFNGYGAMQYDVLNVPPLCGVDYQTDPRRLAFVIMHLVIFIDAIIAFGLFIWTSRWILRDGAGIPRFVREIMAVCLIAPALAGTCLAAAKHSHPYLLLLQDGCYASYVSGGAGYVDLSVTWKIKLATLIGVNI
jgi:hypothetical protein